MHLSTLLLSRTLRVIATSLLACILEATPTVAQPSRDTVTPAADPSATEYRVGAGDVLSIEITGIRTEKVRISNSGKIHLTLLGILRVSGMTAAEVQTEIARLLVERQLVNQPWITVRVTEYLSQPVYILGEVELPGQFAIRGEMYLSDLMSFANGPTELASPIIYLYRRKVDAAHLPEADSPTDVALEIDLHALNEGRNPEQNYRLQGGDILYVPMAANDFVLVVGDVNSPARHIVSRSGLMASRALAMSGGPLGTAKSSKAVVRRVDVSGHVQELPLDFPAILRGTKPDVRLQTGDIIYVPGSKTKSLAYAMAAFLPGTLANGIRRIPR